MTAPEIALLVSSYQRPGHLRRALQSIALQQGVAGRFEVVVTDDGSTDETPQVVNQFARSVDFPVGFTTHPHTTFQLSRCRNEGVAASGAPYLLFLDGDCILPADHVRTHLERRRPGVVMAGDCCRLDQQSSEKITEPWIRSGEFRRAAPADELRRLARFDRRSRFYELIRHPTKPKLIGNNVGIWRSDYERVNGYDENFEGWGCEDDDLRYRLRRAGVHIRSILRWTHTYHLWHPVHVTQPKTWREGLNVRYLLRPGRLTRCRNGLIKRATADLAIRLVGEGAAAQTVQRLVRQHLPPASNAENPEVEILILPGRGRFSGRADCNILVALEDGPQVSRLAARADILVGDRAFPDVDPERQFRLEELPQALKAVA
jgi:glycosyltransferase involved in cell wall biosynthesis